MSSTGQHQKYFISANDHNFTVAPGVVLLQSTLLPASIVTCLTLLAFTIGLMAQHMKLPVQWNCLREAPLKS